LAGYRSAVERANCLGKLDEPIGNCLWWFEAHRVFTGKCLCTHRRAHDTRIEQVDAYFGFRDFGRIDPDQHLQGGFAGCVWAQ
jgi:hypothetical protein